jgi:hypothetical protein
MNASGGAAAPLNDASEEFGTNAPRNDQFGNDDTSASTTSNAKAGATSSSNNNKSSTGSQQSAGGKSSSNNASKSGQDNHGSHEKQGKHDLEEVSREKAKRYVNMDEEDVQHAGTPNSKNDAERSSQRAPKDVGPKEDIELLHGKASLDGNDRSKQSGGSGSGSGSKSGDSGSKNGSANASGNGGHNVNGKGGNGSGHHEEDPMRHNAEKFVNLE